VGGEGLGFDSNLASRSIWSSHRLAISSADEISLRRSRPK
jgi:hypothetical protein